MSTRWLIVVALVVVACYVPHILWASWVYEDGARFREPLMWGPRVVSRAVWWLQGGSPQIVHFVNMLLHCMVAALSGLLAYRLHISAAGARLVTGSVLVSTLSVEAVAYAAQQGELLAAVFVLGACLCATM